MAADTASAAAAAPSGEPAPEESSSQTHGEQADTKPATRRRRATRGTAAPEPDPIAEMAAETQAAAVAAPSDRQPESEAPAADEAPERPAGRRRRATRTAAAAEPTPEPVATEEDREPVAEDSIAAALRMAEEAAQARKALIADPFSVPAGRRQNALDSLADAIASGQAVDDDQDEAEDEDEEAGDEESQDEDDDEQTDEESEESEDSEAGDDSDRPSRRRRRRGGRRRRRGGSRQDAEDADSAEAEDSEEEPDRPSTEEPAEGDEGDNGDSEADDGGGTRRRRRRRRGGRSDDRELGTSNDEITGIEGSTRMEAKRQRRKENRAAGRRRAPILSEAEFLARREAVDRKLVIRQGEDYTQLAVIEDGILVEHYVDRASATSLIGNVYLGRVQNVLPSMEAAFVDIGRGRNAVIYAGEVDWDGFGVSAEDRKVEKVFKSGQTVLVQVTKDPVGAKGARLTGHISLPGRYIVYSPGGHLSGISRKLPDAERARLREILGELISDDESVIVRTAAEGASSEELVRDVNRLKAQWEVIEKKVKLGKAPEALYSEPDLTLRIVRDLFTEDFGRLIVQGNGGPDDQYEAIENYVGHVAPHLAERLERYAPAEDGRDVFTEFRIDEQIAKALDRKVYLPSGGSLVIDRTEAMTVIDVNTGKFTGTGGNLEATVTSNNLEAAEEIVRQLRLRDLGGIIVIDFIDMVLPSNRDLLLRRLVECLARDRTRHQVAEVTSLGLVQLTRKRIGTGLAEAFTEECEHCHGAGYVRHDEPVDSQEQADGGDRDQRRGSRSGSRGRRNGGKS
ncbi:Rne/Rng family ribonuclease [Tessaracoccus sp. OS52]|nr:Rne/Rng family ribonuclease [Tessaracoccus sp. OS52]MCC2592595.1 Rne/Rng family ribonuclease [Tessaracoccus sp. OS52]